MSIESEKEHVSRLRHEEGMKLREIAQKLGKSIYWVNSRLDPTYEPKRTRITADAEMPTGSGEQLTQDALGDEIANARRMRAEGLTYEQIARQLNRSVYWVHSRLRKAYEPRKANTEKRFQEKRVVPCLRRAGHTILEQYARRGRGIFPQEADIISSLDDEFYITEVKVSILQHQFQTAIGQLILHRYAFDEKKDIMLQLALPEEVSDERFTPDLSDYLKRVLGIRLLLVPQAVDG